MFEYDLKEMEGDRRILFAKPEKALLYLNLIRNFFPTQLRQKTTFKKSMLNEYIQLSILDFLSATP